MPRTLFTIGLMLAAAGAAIAQDTQPASQPPTRQEWIQKFTKLQQEMAAAFQDKEYAKAADACREVIQLLPKRPDGYYNLACAMARLGKLQEALDNLAKAVERGYEDFDHLAADEDLQALRDDAKSAAAIKDLVAKAEAKIDEAALKFDEMPGVKTLARAPEGGLRYRLRMSPDAAKDKPDKLIVWLHPSGGLANNAVEPMTKMFLKHGYALVVFTKKNLMGWSDTDARMLVEKTLPDLATIEGLDAAKPILLGFSAGGQMALMLYADDPARYGGLIVDAAYPVIPTAQGYKAMELPNKLVIADVPILAVVGLADGGSKVWQKVEPKWLEKKVPLTVVYVSGAKHAWLLGEANKAERQELDKWLEAVAAGKKPTSQPAATSAPATPLVLAK